jgi:hypothetical protein
MRSCPQTFQEHANQGGIGVALDPQLCLPQLDVNRAGLWLGKIRDAVLDYDRRADLLSLTRTGSNLTPAFGSPSRPAKYGRRQPNT